MAQSPSTVSRLSIGLIAAGLVFSFSPQGGGAPIEKTPRSDITNRPNVLIIVTDDQRGGLNVMPNTRRLFRRQGVSFSNAFVTTPVCCPSRASIFTGRYTHNHGVKSNRWRSGASRFIAEGSLPRLLREAGYRTALVGKYFNGWPLRAAPYDFDEYLTTKGNPYYGGRWNRNGQIGWDKRYSTSIMREAAVDFVRKQRGRSTPGPVNASPWFLHIGTVAPHAPFEPEKRYESADVGRWAQNPAHDEKAGRGKPPFVRDREVAFERAASLREAQLRTLKSVDDLVGKVFEALDETGQSRNTLAFFVSDNGMMHGEYGLISKGFPYSPSIQVPMMMRWPAGSRGGAVDDRLVGNIDVAPTIMDATGLTPSPVNPVDGKSLLDEGWERSRMLFEYWRNARDLRPWASIRTKRWQYIEHYDEEMRRVFRELYDLREDPWQKNNLLKGRSRAGVDVARLERMLERDKRCRGTVGLLRCP